MSGFTSSEVSNGIWFFMNLFCLWTFGYYVAVCFTSNGKLSIDAIKRMITRREYDRELQAAIALTVYFLGAALRGGYNWWLMINDIAPTQAIDYFYIKMGSAALGVIGGVCILRVFTALRWGHIAWMVGGAIAIVVPVITNLFVH